MSGGCEKLHIETPLVRSNALSKENGFEVLLKLENIQLPGSFKIRGIGHMCQKSLDENPKVSCCHGTHSGPLEVRPYLPH